MSYYEISFIEKMYKTFTIFYISLLRYILVRIINTAVKNQLRAEIEKNRKELYVSVIPP